MNLIGLLRQQSKRKKNAGTGHSRVDERLCEDVCAEQLVRTGRYVQLLGAADDEWPTDAVQAALLMLRRKMALVPSGQVEIDMICSSGAYDQRDSNGSAIQVGACFVDRHTVTNAEFEQFVQDGGYSQERLWPPDVLPYVLQFVDTTGLNGPKYWGNGHPPADKHDHPVTGVNWYEANAYAGWCEKRLPNSAEWQRAGTWWDKGVKYPWGNGFDPTRVNTWSAGHADTVVVDHYQSSSTPNGIVQLVGNVWEWVFASIDSAEVAGSSVYFEHPMGEIRGGAFDTYLPTQASCVFRSGLPLLFRGRNVGFRCCVSAGTVQPRNDSISLDDEEVAK